MGKNGVNMWHLLNTQTRILLYSSNIWYFGEGLLGPLFSIYSERIGGSLISTSLAWAVYLISSGILIIIFGQLSDITLNKKKYMLLGYALNTIFTFSYLIVSNPWHLLIIQAGLGLSSALATPTWDALYSQYMDKKHSGLAWGLSGGEGQILTAIAMIIGGFIVTYSSFKILFLVMGIIQLLATLYVSRILKMNQH